MEDNRPTQCSILCSDNISGKAVETITVNTTFPNFSFSLDMKEISFPEFKFLLLLMLLYCHMIECRIFCSLGGNNCLNFPWIVKGRVVLERVILLLSRDIITVFFSYLTFVFHAVLQLSHIYYSNAFPGIQKMHSLPALN